MLRESLLKLTSPHHSLESKINRINDLLHSFKCQSGTNQTDDTDNPDKCVFWKPVFGIDRELEKLFCDIRGQTADVCLVDGYTNLIMDDEQLRMRSTKAAHISLSRNKSPKSFGPVGNDINSISTGLSCHVT